MAGAAQWEHGRSAARCSCRTHAQPHTPSRTHTYAHRGQLMRGSHTLPTPHPPSCPPQVTCDLTLCPDLLLLSEPAPVLHLPLHPPTPTAAPSGAPSVAPTTTAAPTPTAPHATTPAAPTAATLAPAPAPAPARPALPATLAATHMLRACAPTPISYYAATRACFPLHAGQPRASAAPAAAAATAASTAPAAATATTTAPPKPPTPGSTPPALHPTCVVHWCEVCVGLAGAPGGCVWVGDGPCSEGLDGGGGGGDEPCPEGPTAGCGRRVQAVQLLQGAQWAGAGEGWPDPQQHCAASHAADALLEGGYNHSGWPMDLAGLAPSAPSYALEATLADDDVAFRLL